MNVIEFLEQAANCIRYNNSFDNLLINQSNEVKQAVLSGDAALLQRKLSSDEFFANEVDVVNLNS